MPKRISWKRIAITLSIVFAIFLIPYLFVSIIFSDAKKEIGTFSCESRKYSLLKIIGFTPLNVNMKINVYEKESGLLIRWGIFSREKNDFNPSEFVHPIFGVRPIILSEGQKNPDRIQDLTLQTIDVELKTHLECLKRAIVVFQDILEKMPPLTGVPVNLKSSDQIILWPLQNIGVSTNRVPINLGNEGTAQIFLTYSPTSNLQLLTDRAQNFSFKFYYNPENKTYFLKDFPALSRTELQQALQKMKFPDGRSPAEIWSF